MLLSIIQFINLIALAFVVSQPAFYLLAFSQVQRELQGAAYVALRKSIDRNLQISLRVVYYGALASSIFLVALTIQQMSSLLFITSLISLICLLTDMFFMLTGNQPVNKVIKSWSLENFPDDWQSYRDKWLHYFHRRQIADFIGFSSLLVGAVFQ